MRRSHRILLNLVEGLRLAGGGGFDYYVDSVNGNDANDGLTSATAFATISALPAIATGKRIGLARGSHWREQLTIAVNSVAVGAYGSGANPLLDASDIVPVGDWSKTGGQTNVYQATVAADLSVITWVNAWEDDVFLARAASIAACDAAPGSYYPSSDTVGPTITLYVHATDSGNPASNGKVYETSARQSGLMANPYSNITATGITTRRNCHNDGSLRTGRYARRTNGRFEDGGKHNVYVSDGSTLTDCVADDLYYNSVSATLFVHHETTPAGLGVTYTRCQAIKRTAQQGAQGWNGHSSSGNFGLVQWIDCEATLCGYSGGGGTTEIWTRCIATGAVTGFTGGAATNTVEYIACEAHDCTDAGYTASLAPSIIFRGSLAENCANGWRCEDNGITYTFRDACQFKFGATGDRAFSIAGGYVDADGMLICVAIPSGGAIYITETGSQLTLTDCILNTDSSTGGRFAVRSNFAGSATVNIHGCVFDNFTNPIYFGGTPTITFDSDNNFFTLSNGTWRYAATDYLTFAAYQAGTGEDANSVVGGDGSAACV
jgi:hypothetical protein